MDWVVRDFWERAVSGHDVMRISAGDLLYLRGRPRRAFAVERWCRRPKPPPAQPAPARASPPCGARSGHRARLAPTRLIRIDRGAATRTVLPRGALRPRREARPPRSRAARPLSAVARRHRCLPAHVASSLPRSVRFVLLAWLAARAGCW